jgi:hypothetical protein
MTRVSCRLRQGRGQRRRALAFSRFRNDASRDGITFGSQGTRIVLLHPATKLSGHLLPPKVFSGRTSRNRLRRRIRKSQGGSSRGHRSAMIFGQVRHNISRLIPSNAPPFANFVLASRPRTAYKPENRFENAHPTIQFGQDTPSDDRRPPIVWTCGSRTTRAPFPDGQHYERFHSSQNLDTSKRTEAEWCELRLKSAEHEGFRVQRTGRSERQFRRCEASFVQFVHSSLRPAYIDFPFSRFW